MRQIDVRDSIRKHFQIDRISTCTGFRDAFALACCLLGCSVRMLLLSIDVTSAVAQMRSYYHMLDEKGQDSAIRVQNISNHFLPLSHASPPLSLSPIENTVELEEKGGSPRLG